MNRKFHHRHRGLTLIELLIAVLILTILVVVALPSYQSYRLKTARNAGVECLLEAQRRMETLYARLGRYPPAGAGTAALGYSDDPHACDTDGLYRLSLDMEHGPDRYRLTATARGRQRADGDLLLDVDPGQANPNQRMNKQHRRPDGNLVPSWTFKPGR